MQYISTRGKAAALSFEEVVTTGVATDGGLYVPKALPKFSRSDLERMKSLPYQALAFEVMYPFISGSLDQETLKDLITKAYSGFRHEEITPLVPLDVQKGEYVLELFHGPTLAFKDVALQFLGQLFDHVLSTQQKHVTIIGATSGDTGSAAIEGCYRSQYVNMFILHPKDRISDVQRRQMTSVIAPNVHNLAVESDFDFCQTAVKDLFNDQEFLAGKTSFVAVNSINWCRIMAQIVYYFYAALQLGAPQCQVSFSVPTGNFGDIYAGFLAKQMGLPIDQLIIATNANDILHRFLSANDYSRSQLHATLSPSMDIQVSSNFERLLFDLYWHNGKAIEQLMHDFKQGKLTVDSDILTQAREVFASARADDECILTTIANVYQAQGMVIDPHTATAVYAARTCRRHADVPMVILATAHPAKFPEAIVKAGVPEPKLPAHLASIMQAKEACTTLPADIDALKAFIKAHV